MSLPMPPTIYNENNAELKITLTPLGADGQPDLNAEPVTRFVPFDALTRDGDGVKVDMGEHGQYHIDLTPLGGLLGLYTYIMESDQ